jgi:hypothetical protein
MQTPPLPRTSVSMVPASPRSPLWVALVTGLLGLALALGYVLGQAAETQGAILP